MAPIMRVAAAATAVLATLGAATAAATPPIVAPYKSGATQDPGWVWECQWDHDVSTVQVYKLGCADCKPKESCGGILTTAQPNVHSQLA